MTSQVMKHPGNMMPPVLPTLKSKSRILSTVTNKETAPVDALEFSKSALERQRENASRLASGRSVIAKADKENEGAIRKSSKIAPKLPQKQRKPFEPKKIGPQKNNIIVPEPEITKPKKISATVTKLDRVTATKNWKTTVTKDESKVKSALKPQAIPKEEEVKKVMREQKNTLNVEKVEEEIEDEDEEIPPGVNFIDDDNNLENEFLLGVYSKDIYKFMRHLEKVQSIRKNYLTPQHIMTQQMRAVLVDWIFEVQLTFRLLNETVHLTIAIFDRFMQNNPYITKDKLQLVVIACLFLASKYEERFPPDLDDLMDISANTFTKAEILKMEQNIFKALDFQMGRPLPSQFFRRYGRAGKVDAITYSFGKYFIDLALLNYSLCHEPPSLLAAAALYLSLNLTTSDSNSEIWSPTLKYYTTYSKETLKPLVSQIASIVLKAPKSSQQTVPTKYLNLKVQRNVSARPELKSEKLIKIAEEKYDA